MVSHGGKSKQKLTNAQFNIILSTAWSKFMTQNNIINGFEATFALFILSAVPVLPTSDDIDNENCQPLVSPRSVASELLDESPLTTVVEKKWAHTKQAFVSFYHLVSGSSGSNDDENHAPLAQIKGTAFHHLMPTPIKNTEKIPTIRKTKALNYRGTPINKDLFEASELVL